MSKPFNPLMDLTLVQVKAQATWELVDEFPSFGPTPPLRMLSSSELASLQGFTPPVFTTETPPCAHFATPQKPRLA